MPDLLNVTFIIVFLISALCSIVLYALENRIFKIAGFLTGKLPGLRREI